ncbi:MAG: hypothetical protein NTW30_01290 [Candidatus Aenigmarchaeota archaeon]|nr:hypothetical protein [Candidatus Aenigmarchaeota archaeon]
MKKIVIALTVMMLLSTATFKIQAKATATSDSNLSNTLSTRSNIFYENFESYPLGEFQSTGSWNLYLGDSEDSEKQCIVNSVSVSPSKSLQLWSYHSGVLLNRRITISGDYIGYQVYVMMASLWEAKVQLAFTNTQNQESFSEIWLWADTIDAMAYLDLVGRRTFNTLQKLEAMRWYNITVLTNKNTYEFSVWIDNVLKKSGLEEEPGRSDYGPIDCFNIGIAGGREDQKAYFDDISVFQELPQEKTNVEIQDVQYQKWNLLNVPFNNVEEANNYINDFQTTHSTANFGVIPINVILRNSGSYKAQGSIVAKLTGNIIMIAYGSETTVVPYHFDYELSFEVQIDIGASINKALNLQVRYASLISTELKPKDEYGNEVSLNVIISMVSIHVAIIVQGNFDEKRYDVPQDILGIGDPRGLLEKWRAELWPRVKETMLRNFLEKYYTEVVGITPNFQTIADVPTGTYKPTINILPGTTKIAVSFLIPIGITLVGLTLLPWGATTPFGATLIAAGLAMVVINNPTPGIGKITLDTGVGAAGQMITISSTTMDLEIVQMIPNNVKTNDYTVNIPGNTLHVIVTSNSTITGFGFNGEIYFNSGGQPGTIGFTYIAVPKALMSSITNVYVDGNQVNIIPAENATYTFAYFTYTNSKDIRVVPEFSVLLLLSMMIVSLIAVIGRKKIQKMPINIHFFLFFD